MRFSTQARSICSEWLKDLEAVPAALSIPEVATYAKALRRARGGADLSFEVIAIIAGQAAEIIHAGSDKSMVAEARQISEEISHSYDVEYHPGEGVIISSK